MSVSNAQPRQYPTPLPGQKLFLLLLLSLLVIGCAEVPKRLDPVPARDQAAVADQAMQHGDYARAHALYLQLAEENPPPKSWEYQLLAAQALYHGGMYNQAQEQLERIPLAQLHPALRFEHQLLQGAIQLRRDAAQALETLARARVSEDELPRRPDLFARYHQLRAQAFERQDKYLESAREHILREIYLSDAVAIEENQRQIWQALSQVTPQALQNFPYLPPPDALSGWVELVTLVRQYQRNPAELQLQLGQWRFRYPGHPASDGLLATLLQRSDELSFRPNQIALLLPLTGRYAAAARAIQDGIVTAWYADPDHQQIRLRVTDVGDDPSQILDYYRQAVADGAELIIGPLDKAAVETLTIQSALPVPTLALNFASPPLNAQLYQFALTPEDEARAVADRAAQQGWQGAALLTPNTALGERMTEAFTQRWHELGGVILNHTFYNPADNDYAAPLKSMLNISDSELRHSRINRFSNRRVEFTPRRRQDLDFVFLVAQPRQGRMMRPQLRFHHAGDLPVLATSHIFDGRLDPGADRDLDGVFFSDMPWVLNADTVTAELRELSREQLAHHSGQLQRLVAMGIDAYQLVPMLGAMRNNPFELYAGETGLLSIDSTGLVNRQLHWARFTRGTPQLLLEQPEQESDVWPHTR